MNTLYEQVQIFLGSKIGCSEWERARAYAERKLDVILEQKGGEAKDDDYGALLAQLIAETVQNNRVSQFTYAITKSYHYAERQMGAKKKARVRQREQFEINYAPYCSTDPNEMQ